MYRIKEKFNQEFEEVFQAKVSEIQHIREKNVRIKKIINDLKLTDEKVHEPGYTSIKVYVCVHYQGYNLTELDEDEQPQNLLMVKDEEVTVEKYYSPEEKQKMEEAAKLEEERRKAELVGYKICNYESFYAFRKYILSHVCTNRVTTLGSEH